MDRVCLEVRRPRCCMPDRLVATRVAWRLLADSDWCAMADGDLLLDADLARMEERLFLALTLHESSGSLVNYMGVLVGSLASLVASLEADHPDCLVVVLAS